MTLEEVYKKLLTGEMTSEEGAEYIKSPEIKQLINTYINKDRINNLVPYFEEDLHNIYMIINITQFIYNNTGEDTGISDIVYDELYEIMISNGGSDVISAPVTPSASNIAYHKYPQLRGTLTKIFYLSKDEKRTNPSRKYLDEWKTRMENIIYDKTGTRINLDNEEVYVFPKFDGVSAVFEYNENNMIDRVLTRGYTKTNEAQDVTKIFSNLLSKHREYREYPKGMLYGHKVEVMINESDLKYYNKKYKTDYKSTRSLTSSILNSNDYDVEKSSLLKLISLRVGDVDGNQHLASDSTNVPYLRCLLRDREAIRDFALKHKYINKELRCDGAVIYIINPKLQEILGREDNKNNYEVAYKFTEEVEFSILKDINYTVGLFGKITPVAQIKPVKMKGNTIENISLGSVSRIRELKLRKGDKIKVLYDIIPYLSFDSECSHNMDEDIFELPKMCPECGSDLEYSESGDSAYCKNDNCACRKKGKILNYLYKMNIAGLSYGVIDKLYDYRIVKSIKDIYHLNDKRDEILAIDGIGEISLDTWIAEIDSHRTLPDYEFLGSLGIEGISSKTFEKVMRELTIDELISDNLDKSRLIAIPGIQEKTANKIIDGIWENSDLISILTKELTISNSKGKINESKFSVCFTKVRNSDKEKFVINNGGSVVDSLTKNTTFLVVPSLDTESSKVGLANKYGVKIVSIDDMEKSILEFLDK